MNVLLLLLFMFRQLNDLPSLFHPHNFLFLLHAPRFPGQMLHLAISIDVVGLRHNS